MVVERAPSCTKSRYNIRIVVRDGITADEGNTQKNDFFLEKYLITFKANKKNI